MNTELLLNIRGRILSEPEHFQMENWSQITPCGAACCIAGWAFVLSSYSKDTPVSVVAEQLAYSGLNQIVASDELDLDYQQSQRLFHVEQWPKDFVLMWIGSSSDAQRALIGSRRIDHFIATDGRE